jgi:hypothetical protein
MRKSLIVILLPSLLIVGRMQIQYIAAWLALFITEAAARGGHGSSCYGCTPLDKLMAVAVAFGIGIVVLFIGGLRKVWGDERDSRDRERFLVEQYIPQMSEKEREMIGYLLAHNKKSFATAIDDKTARRLMSRFIAHWSAPPGDGRMSLKIPEHIWEVLVKHRNQFPNTSAAGMVV